MNMISNISDSSERYRFDVDHSAVAHFPEQELTEEKFFEQFAALEDGLALLQIHMHGMSENAKRFGSLARHMRRSICPATLSSR